MKLKGWVPGFLRPAARRLYHSAFRARLRVEWWLRDRFEPSTEGSLGAVPPAHLRFRVGEDSRLTAFLEVGRRTAEHLEEALGQAGLPFADGQRVLDFGCGCGRTLRWLIERFPAVRWCGTDVDAEAVAWSAAHFPHAEFVVGQALPPLDFADGTFDVIYAVSVFTHLSEEFQRAWIVELERILKPGGVLLLSLYSERVWRAQPEARDVAEGGFVFRTSDKLKGIVPEWYHTALQSRERITSLVEGRFSRIAYLERALGDHDVVMAWKTGP